VTSPFAFLPNIGPLEVAIVLLILIVIFGPKRIPAAFRSIGDALRGFRDTIGGEEEDVKEPAALADSSKEDGDPPASGDRGSETAGQYGGRSEAKTDV
jgi:sec-independent protein translocase protein TatA